MDLVPTPDGFKEAVAGFGWGVLRLEFYVAEFIAVARRGLERGGGGEPRGGEPSSPSRTPLQQARRWRWWDEGGKSTLKTWLCCQGEEGLGWGGSFPGHRLLGFQPSRGPCLGARSSALWVFIEDGCSRASGGSL